MTRRRYVFDEARVQRFLAEGRGTGDGPHYRPWLQVQDVSSMGRSHRPFGIKTQRVHHLLSDGEWKSFLRLEGDPRVIDIWEQFPMDRLETFRLAQKLGIKHPVTLDGTPYVMTLDFVVTVLLSQGPRLVPYTFKYSPELLPARDQELMTITRAFCEARGMELQLIDQRFFDEPFVLNYDSVRAYDDISKLAFAQEVNVSGIKAALHEEIRLGGDETLLRTCRALAGTFGTESYVVYQIAMHLVSRGVLRVDLSSSTGLERLPLSAYTAVVQDLARSA